MNENVVLVLKNGEIKNLNQNLIYEKMVSANPEKNTSVNLVKMLKAAEFINSYYQLLSLEKGTTLEFKEEELDKLIYEKLIKLDILDYISEMNGEYKEINGIKVTNPKIMDAFSDLLSSFEQIISCSNDEMIKENANMNGTTFSGKMGHFGKEAAKFFALNVLIKPEIREAFIKGFLHIHDLDNYAVGNHNCTFIPFAKLLERGFSTGNGSVRPPKRISTAADLVAIIFQSQQNCQFGGVAANMFDWDMEKYVKLSFIEHFDFIDDFLTDEKSITELKTEEICIDNKELEKEFPIHYKYALKMTIKETSQAMESVVHNLNTMSSRAGECLPDSYSNMAM